MCFLPKIRRKLIFTNLRDFFDKNPNSVQFHNPYEEAIFASIRETVRTRIYCNSRRDATSRNYADYGSITRLKQSVLS